MSRVQKGDLVYIPQDVRIFDMENRYIKTTDRPVTGLLLGEGTQTSYFKIYVLGVETSIDSKFVYPLGDKNAD
jgi:hypothetical protein